MNEIFNSEYRVVSSKHTYSRIMPFMNKFKMIIKDITDYESICIPVYAIEQKDEDGNAHILSYGKGVNSIQSQVSAMMEAIERYTAELLPPATVSATYAEMKQKYTVIIPVKASDINDNMLIDWLPGRDLISKTEVWVPACDVLLSTAVFNYHQSGIQTTNGLASGNIFEEAICHGLYELIERDAWTLAWLGSVTIPQMQYMARRVRSGDIFRWDNSDFLSQSDMFPLIDHDSLLYPAKCLIEQFTKAGISIAIRNITSDIGIATIIVAGYDGSTLFYGTGTHLNSHIAMMRAITECAQSRQAKIQSGLNRDNLSYIQKIKQGLFFQKSPVISFEELPNHDIGDILEIELILSQLLRVGLKKVIVVDITHPEMNIPVVRMFIPGVENWSIFNFSPDYFNLSCRGQNYLTQRM
jgi:ribosomal protein S12 methylthiotransferase accessory factor YcaO